MDRMRRKKMIWIAIAALVLALAACGSADRPTPPPTFAAWCDGCENYAEWDILDDRFECSASGTIWEVGQ